MIAGTRIFLVLACAAVTSLFADPATDWEAIRALDSGPKAEAKSPEELKAASLQHLDRQEKALRTFLAAYPEDPHCFAASLRLAHLLVVRGQLKPGGKDWDQSMQVLDQLASRSAPENRVDIDFARISLGMYRLQPGNNSGNEALLQQARSFQVSYPKDRRVARLLVEIATLFDEQPARKESLLREARAVATDIETQRRIDDDLKRVALIDQPLDLQFISTQGKPVDLKDYRGKVVFVVFFADWSQPSMVAVQGVQNALKKMPQAKAIGISLDQSAEKLAAVVKSNALDWPIAFDGKAWNSPLVRSFGINTLPTVWLVDRNGLLRRLNVRADWEEAIRKAP